jgi:hypothetical protein
MFSLFMVLLIWWLIVAVVVVFLINMAKITVQLTNKNIENNLRPIKVKNKF